MHQVANQPSRPVSFRILDIRACQVQAQVQQSEYQDAYKKWPWHAPRKAIRPTVPSKYRADGPAHLKTTHQAHFVPHKTQPVVKKAPAKPEITIPIAKTPTVSTYVNDYQEKSATRPPACKPKERPALAGLPFDAKSVYEETYVKWDRDELNMHKVEIKVHQDNLGRGSKSLFAATTTVQDDFRKHDNVNPAVSMKPKESPHTSTKPFEDATTHRVDFTAKAISTRQAIRPRQQRTIHPDSKFNGETTFHRDFPAHKDHQPEPSFKPERKYFKSEDVFDGRTTMRTAYQQWPVPVREPTPWANKGRSSPLSHSYRARLDVKTSYQDAFQNPKDIMALDRCRGKPYRYGDNDLGLGGGGEGSKLNDCTNYRQSYVEWKDARPPASYKVVEDYKRPIVPFMAVSTSQKHYQGLYALPAKSCKPTQRPQSSPADGRDASSNRPIIDATTRPASCPVLQEK